MNHTSIKNWAEEDRPREKALQHGLSVLTETELLAIIIGSGTQSESAIDLAKKVYASARNNLSELCRFSFEDFQKIKGIGQVKAITLMAVFELGRRRNLAEAFVQESIRSSKETFKIMHPKIGDLAHEEFWAIYLNNKNVVLAMKRISSGGVSMTVADTKIIARHAITLLATGVVVCHNHPAGNLEPSKEDVELTKRIKEALQLIDCRLLDHLIVSGYSYFSFCDKKML